jgi:hypothetical protein
VGKNETTIDILLLNLDIMKDANHQKKTHKKTRGYMFSKQRLLGGNNTEPTSLLIVKQILIL